MTKLNSFHLFFLIITTIMFGCSDNSKKEKNQDDIKKADPNKNYELKEANDSGFISISADGLGTYRKIQVNIVNKSEGRININLPSGLYFENPDKNAQSLITAREIGLIQLEKFEKKEFEIASFCTNVNQSVPAYLKNWKFISNFDGGLDEVIEFYGNHEKSINEWLEKKNKNFSLEENRLLFFQVVIWYHEGGKHDAILNMLSKDVFKNDIEKAKAWLDEISTEAQELASAIKEKDNEKIKSWLKDKLLQLMPSDEKIDESVSKIKKLAKKTRARQDW